MQQTATSAISYPSVWTANIRAGVFLVGAPRCGTTAFSKALARNPQICFSKPKEPHFFTRSHPELTEAEMKEAYLRMFFPHLNNDHWVIAEGSVSYLYSPDAIKTIMAFDPAARFIAMVRNPMDMMPSYHARLLFTLDEDVRDFARAWSLQETRRAGRQIPRRCRDPRLLQYAAIGKLGEHIDRLFQTAGRERCHVVVFDDFVRDPIQVYKDTLAFIGVDYDGRTTLPQKNQNRGFKNAWLQQFVMNPPRPLARFIEKRQMKGLDWLAYLRPLRRRIKKFNKVEEKRSPLPESLRQLLRTTFADDIERLSRLLNRDLSHWR